MYTYIYKISLSLESTRRFRDSVFVLREREQKEKERERESSWRSSSKQRCFTLRDFVLCRLSLPRFRLLFYVLWSWISWEVGDENLIRLDFRYRETLIDRVVVSLFLFFFPLFLKISVKLKMDSMGWFERYSSFRVTFRKFIFSLLLRISTNFFIIS